jgi:peptidylprolyl isomerase
VVMSPSNSRRRRSHKKKTNNKKRIMIVALLAVFVVVAIVGYIMLGTSNSGENDSNTNADNLPSTNKVELVTSMGNIMIELRDDMPITTNNFKNLAQQGVYDNTIFHRVIDGFMIQGGDPTGTGFGDPSIPNIKDEFTDNNKNDRGTIAMANTGAADSGSSQFFINLVDNNYLDSKHPVFGNVIEGMDVVDAIAKVATDDNDKPIEDVVLLTITFVE